MITYLRTFLASLLFLTYPVLGANAETLHFEFEQGVGDDNYLTYTDAEALAKISSGAQYIESVSGVRVGTDGDGNYFVVGNIEKYTAGGYIYGGCLALHLKPQYRGYISTIDLTGFHIDKSTTGSVMVNGILKTDLVALNKQSLSFEVNEYAEDIIIYTSDDNICIESMDVAITPGSEYAPAAPWYTHSNCIQMHGSTFAGNLMTPMLIHSAGAERLTIGINESETLYFDGNEAVIYPTEGATYHLTAYNQYGASRTTTVTYSEYINSLCHNYLNFSPITIVNSTDQLVEGARYMIHCADTHVNMSSTSTTVNGNTSNLYIDDDPLLGMLTSPMYYYTDAIFGLTKSGTDKWEVAFDRFNNKSNIKLGYNGGWAFTFTDKAVPVTIEFEGNNAIIKFADATATERYIVYLEEYNGLYWYSPIDEKTTNHNIQLCRIDAYNISATAAANGVYADYTTHLLQVGDYDYPVCTASIGYTPALTDATYHIYSCGIDMGTIDGKYSVVPAPDSHLAIVAERGGTPVAISTIDATPTWGDITNTTIAATSTGSNLIYDAGTRSVYARVPLTLNTTANYDYTIELQSVEGYSTAYIANEDGTSYLYIPDYLTDVNADGDGNPIVDTSKLPTITATLRANIKAVYQPLNAAEYAYTSINTEWATLNITPEPGSISSISPLSDDRQAPATYRDLLGRPADPTHPGIYLRTTPAGTTLIRK